MDRTATCNLLTMAAPLVSSGVLSGLCSPDSQCLKVLIEDTAALLQV
jgi:hypothetical protein